MSWAPEYVPVPVVPGCLAETLYVGVTLRAPGGGWPRDCQVRVHFTCTVSDTVIGGDGPLWAGAVGPPRGFQRRGGRQELGTVGRRVDCLRKRASKWAPLVARAKVPTVPPWPPPTQGPKPRQTAPSTHPPVHPSTRPPASPVRPTSPRPSVPFRLLPSLTHFGPFLSRLSRLLCSCLLHLPSCPPHRLLPSHPPSLPPLNLLSTPSSPSQDIITFFQNSS